MVRKSRKSREDWKIYKNVFDTFTERTLFNLSTQGHFQEVESPIALGKEANIFYGHKKDGTPTVIKIYRLENSNFNKMHYYINSDPRFTGLENQKRKIIFTWVQREYRNLLLAREKIKVPTPLAFKDNVLVMEFIGKEHPAPQLKNAKPANPKEFLRKTIKNIKLLIDAGIIHGDLSDFNILNHEEEPIFIDFSQGTPTNSSNAQELLERDIKNIIKYFKRITDFDEKKTEEEIINHFKKKQAEKL